MKEENSYTGKYLKMHIEREEKRKKNNIKLKFKNNYLNIIIM